MFTIGGYEVLDIIYGGSMFDLGCWIGFGVCSQLIVGILVCGRRPMWADACWGLLKVQLLLAVLVNVTIYVNTCLCLGDPRMFALEQTRLLLFKIVFYLVHFSLMSTAIWWRYRRSPRLTPLHVASVITPVIDLGVLLVTIVAVLFGGA